MQCVLRCSARGDGRELCLCFVLFHRTIHAIRPSDRECGRGAGTAYATTVSAGPAPRPLWQGGRGCPQGFAKRQTPRLACTLRGGRIAAIFLPSVLMEEVTAPPRVVGDASSANYSCAFVFGHWRRAGIADVFGQLTILIELARSYSCAAVVPSPMAMLGGSPLHATWDKEHNPLTYNSSPPWSRYLRYGPQTSLPELYDSIAPPCLKHAMTLTDRVPTRDEIGQWLAHAVPQRAGNTAGASCTVERVMHMHHSKEFKLNVFWIARVQSHSTGGAGSMNGTLKELYEAARAPSQAQSSLPGLPRTASRSGN